jgi:transcriptional regulator with XRE-family HTH domain
MYKKTVFIIEQNHTLMRLNMIGQRIKQFRTEKNIKQEVLAHAIGVTTQTILKWEKGDYEPKVSQLRKIGNYLGIPLCELIDEDSSEPNEKLKASMMLIEQLSEEEQAAAMTILEALVLKSQTERTRAQFKMTR